MSEPSKGPWTIDGNYIVDAAGDVIADGYFSTQDSQRDEANLRLMAAAWEMREALQPLVRWLGRFPSDAPDSLPLAFTAGADGILTVGDLRRCESLLSRLS